MENEIRYLARLTHDALMSQGLADYGTAMHLYGEALRLARDLQRSQLVAVI